jgi:AmmeMemoRadiSam system protein B/AmmeMemoRadiSam system protein A
MTEGIGRLTSAQSKWMRTVFVILCVGAVLLLTGCRALTATPTARPMPLQAETPTPAVQDIRHPVVAGSFYPSEPTELRDLIHALLDQAEPMPQEPIAVIVPHAGYLFSGAVAATAFRQLEGRRYEAIIVLGTNHSAADFRKIAVWPSGAYSTPLGLLPVDAELAQSIIEANPERIVADRSAQLAEHSIEVELPFLQCLDGCDAFVPIMIGEPSWENCQTLSEVLVKVLSGKKALIVASSDLSHYPSYQDAVSVDLSSLLAICSMDTAAVLNNTRGWITQGVPNLVCTMCGEGPVLTAMMAAQGLGANRGTLLHYANSGDTPYGDRDQVVGYGAVVLWQGKTAVLDADQRAELLQIARQTLVEYLSTGAIPDITPVAPVLRQPNGAFVTLKADGQLRGCIGNTWGREPLYRTAQQMAIAAATRDLRFAPLSVEELEDTRIEISVLSPLRYVHDAEEIRVGRDGLYITLGSDSGLLLPQVPVEQGWDRAEFLRQICFKAGLTADAWKEGALLYRFGAQVFGEEG